MLKTIFKYLIFTLIERKKICQDLNVILIKVYMHKYNTTTV